MSDFCFSLHPASFDSRSKQSKGSCYQPNKDNKLHQQHQHRKKKRRQLTQTHQYNSINKFDSVFIHLSLSPFLFSSLFSLFYFAIFRSYIKDLDTRIIIGSFSHELAPRIFCEVHCIFSEYIHPLALIRSYTVFYCDWSCSN